jgi:predicted lipoprotein with Yx(FWY)xxD motif
MRRTITLLLAPLLAAVVLAACGGGGTTTNQATAAGPTTTVARAAATNPNVKTAMNDRFGEILTDTSGKALYTLTDNGKDVPCTGQCAAIWPPLAGTDYYRFVNDKAAGDVNGDGIQNFGGVWHVAHPAGASTPATSAPTATTEAPMSSGGGYGY